MTFDPFTAAIELGKTAIEKLWPDPIRRAEEMRKLEEMRQAGQLAELKAHVDLMLGQIEINKIEAGSKSAFVAGWRPGVGWLCVFGIGYHVILYPILLWVWVYLEATGRIPPEMTPPPVLPSGPLMTLVMSMLGVGGMRSYDKAKGTQTDKIK